MNTVDLIIPICNYNNAVYNGFVDTLNFVLTEFIGKQKDIDINLILVEQLITPNRPLYTMALKIPQNVKCTKIVVNHEKFDKAWLYNIGVRNSVSDHIVFCDADVYINDENYLKDFIEWVIKENNPWAFGFDLLHRTSAEEYKYIQQNKTAVKSDNSLLVTPFLGANEGGLFYMCRSFYLGMGMANEWILGTEFAVNELVYRANYITNTYPQYISHTLIHLWHPVSILKQEPSAQINRELYEFSKKNTELVNSYFIGCGFGNKEGPVFTNREYTIYSNDPKLHSETKRARRRLMPSQSTVNISQRSSFGKRINVRAVQKYNNAVEKRVTRENLESQRREKINQQRIILRQRREK